MPAFWTSLDGYQRLLAALAAAAVASLALAILAVSGSAARREPAFAPAVAFPGLVDRGAEIGTLVMRTSEGEIRAVLDAGGRWILPAKGGYPVNGEALRSAVVGMMELTLIEPKTRDPERYGLLDLGDPASGGRAVELVLLAKDGTTELAHLFVGREPPLGEIGGRNAVYVRKAGEERAFLALGTLAPERRPADWLAQDILDLPRERIASVTLQPASGEGFTFKPAAGEGSDYELAALPAGQKLKSPYALAGIAGALSGFAIEDVRSAADLAMGKADRAIYRTKDGLLVTVSLVTEGDKPFAAITAEVDRDAPGDDAARATLRIEAEGLNARLSPWIFEIPPYKADQLRTSLASLLEPEAPAPAPAAAPEPAAGNTPNPP